MRASLLLISALLALGLPPGALAQDKQDNPPAQADPVGAPDARESICLMIEAAARANALPVDFFARVIWQESRFQPDEVGPMTRSGERAQGIAQFMPGTAAERQLLDPFNPVQALPKSAEFLSELRNQFGNLGLAAAAYNAGPGRVREFLAGTRALPAQTRNYVLAITGRSVDDWAKPSKGTTGPAGKDETAAQPPEAASTCHDLMALLKRAPSPFVEQLEQHINLVAAAPWGVQLNAGFSRDRVLFAYSNVAKRFNEILAGHDPSIFSTVLRSRGTHPFYEVRVGAATREEAGGLCAKIHHAGGACFVLRNTGKAG